MTRQYLRKVSLLVGPESGEGLELSEFKIQFRAGQWDVQTPNTLYAKVFNLAPRTGNRIRGEFQRVVLRAGYEGSFGTIFDGTIKQVRIGRESAVDSYVEIAAADGDLAYNFATVNQSLAAGASSADVVASATSAFSQQGVVVGYAPDLGLRTYPRGVALYGMARDVMTDELTGLDMAWSIQNGVCQVVPRDSYIPGEAIVINKDTGMVGVPEQTEDGIRVRCLLNPNIRVSGLIRLDNSSIQEYRQDLRFAALNLAQMVSQDAGGFYKVLSVDHSGDTRGQEYYSDIVCVARQDVTTISQAARGRG